MPELLSEYLDYLRYELNRAPLTVEAYRNDIKQFMEWLSPGNPGAIDFSSVTSSDVRGWLSSLARAGDIPRTLRRKIISLRTLFKWMMKRGMINRSPLRDVPLPKIPKPLPDLVKGDEIEAALENLHNEEDENKAKTLMESLIVEILYSLGLRRAELAGLNDSDISFHKGEMKVTGKRSKQRVVPVPEKLLSKIAEWQQERDICEEKPEGENALFIIKGKRISHAQIYTIVNRALKDSTARKKSPHALRHSFASAMLNGGAEIDSVREFLGHASLATTQIYTHISLNEIKKAYNGAHPRAGRVYKNEESDKTI
ncbi:MAG: tyrosine-type recombinase/integrase [Muribaculaceae bacterium]|nr:tyrosine-type recombinase/integrase [Muribaculaceae bacterium]